MHVQMLLPSVPAISRTDRAEKDWAVRDEHVDRYRERGRGWPNYRDGRAVIDGRSHGLLGSDLWPHVRTETSLPRSELYLPADRYSTSRRSQHRCQVQSHKTMRCLRGLSYETRISRRRRGEKSRRDQSAWQGPMPTKAKVRNISYELRYYATHIVNWRSAHNSLFVQIGRSWQARLVMRHAT